MKSEKQTYEAFLRGANQAPAPLSVSVPTSNQHQQQGCPPPPTSNVAMATSISSGGGSGKPSGVGGGGGGGKVPSQQKVAQQQQNLQPSPADSMQTVQRLLTQGTLGPRCKVHSAREAPGRKPYRTGANVSYEQTCDFKCLNRRV